MLFADALADYTVAATPQGVMTLLNHYGIETFGKQAVVVGRSQLFGRPMFALLNNADATVTLPALGIQTKDIPTDANATTESVLQLVAELNADDNITGILVQSPLAEGVKEREVFSAVAPHKDADGLGL
ncbi:hypothetical protein GQS40_10285|uniref:Tetrahydrofolate dehydrogenase/cyclohydrolase catalytic domain-containing protein n=1 Tax=Leuconostoc lactis TaxID=1246 RepID=A0A6L7AAS5_LEULA|nr:hypothetical protein [Leuconostoc lactis]